MKHNQIDKEAVFTHRANARQPRRIFQAISGFTSARFQFKSFSSSECLLNFENSKNRKEKERWSRLTNQTWQRHRPIELISMSICLFLVWARVDSLMKLLLCVVLSTVYSALKINNTTHLSVNVDWICRRPVNLQLCFAIFSDLSDKRHRTPKVLCSLFSARRVHVKEADRLSRCCTGRASLLELLTCLNEIFVFVARWVKILKNKQNWIIVVKSLNFVGRWR